MIMDDNLKEDEELDSELYHLGNVELEIEAEWRSGKLDF